MTNDRQERAEIQRNIDNIIEMMTSSRDGEPGEGCVIFALKFKDYPNDTGAERHTHMSFNCFGRGVDHFLISKSRQIITKFSENMDLAVGRAIESVNDDPHMAHHLKVGVLGTMLMDSVNKSIFEATSKK